MRYLFIILVLSLVTNVLVIIFLFTHSHPSSAQANITDLTKKYPYLSKRVLAELPNDYIINFLGLRNTLREQVKPYGETFAFYFEFLPTGSSIGVNEKAEFPAASLLKVPVVMAYLHQKERTREADKEVAIKSDEIDNTFGTLWKAGVGSKITLSNAMKKSIIESDNTAARVLTDNTQIDDFTAVYSGLDIDLKEGEGGVILTAKHYSSILKALFFSSLLSKDNSQYLLDLLTKTIFDDKLPQGVPKDIPVAHKVGIYSDKLFSDCGIVYVPRRPYILCMISATDENTARSRMLKVSKAAYDYISTINPTK